MGGLISTAFQDPFYLRFKYKPVCEDHVVPTRAPSHGGGGGGGGGGKSQGNRRSSSSSSSSRTSSPSSSSSRRKSSTSYNTIEHRVSSSAGGGVHVHWSGREHVFYIIAYRWTVFLCACVSLVAVLFRSHDSLVTT